MDGVSVNNKLYSLVEKSLKDNRLTLKEISAIEKQVNSNENVSEAEKKLLSAIFEGKDKFIVSSTNIFNASKTVIDPSAIKISFDDDTTENNNSMIQFGDNGVTVKT